MKSYTLYSSPSTKEDVYVSDNMSIVRNIGIKYDHQNISFQSCYFLLQVNLGLSYQKIMCDAK
jgi:hypothetical protein